MSDADLDRILDERVYAGDRYRPFSEMTLAQVEARARELREASAVPAAQRVAAVAAAWEGLAEAMRRQPAPTVGELDREQLGSRADRLWVTPPGGSFL